MSLLRGAVETSFRLLSTNIIELYRTHAQEERCAKSVTLMTLDAALFVATTPGHEDANRGVGGNSYQFLVELTHTPTYPSAEVCGRQLSGIFPSFSNSQSATLITLPRPQALTTTRKPLGRMPPSGNPSSVDQVLGRW